MGDIVPGSAKCRLRSVAWFAFKCSVTWQVKKKKKKSCRTCLATAGVEEGKTETENHLCFLT